MPFVVRATGRTGTISWLSAANDDGFRSLVTREMADVFQTVSDAHTAIAKLPRAFEHAGVIFSVRDGRTAAPSE
ncbi:MAG TPA: hypothetical protein VG055_17330 [Planctomycetaceae bacterium]|jgi:hypothetical protein|nr:hypothetical protein [Planctomycetaceae bacterium]